MFLAPFFLIAAGVGAAIPLILHMMQNRKRVQMAFPTLRFLQLAQKQSSRRIRIENLLLWLIRTLIMALLGMAFAMPILRRQGFAWLGKSSRDIAIVIDNSYSMGYNTGRDTVWTKSIDAARAIITGLGENDRFCLYLARELPDPIIAEPVGDKKLGLKLLDGLALGTGTSQLAPAVTAAVTALRKDASGRDLELHVLTDNQALPWDGFSERVKGGGTAAWDPHLLGDHLGVFVTLLGVSAPENAGPSAVELMPPIVRPGSPAQVSVSLTHSGQGSQTTATLFIDGEQRARRQLGTGTSTNESSGFVLPPLKVGVHEARIETPADNLPLDDVFHFLIRVEQPRPTLLVGSPDDTLFVRTALRTATGRQGTAPKLVAPAQLAGEPLDSYDCVILCNALPLTGQAIGALEDFVRRGRMLMIFPGAQASIADYSSWTCLPGKPATINDVPLVLRHRNLSWDQPLNPMARALHNGDSTPPLTVRYSLTWKDLHPETKSLMSMGAGSPFLLDRVFGAGHVLLFAISADRTWSDFPLSPFFLPMLVQGIEYGSGLGSKDPFYWAGIPLPLEGLVPQNATGVSVLDPGRHRVPVSGTTQDGRTRLSVNELTEPGVYTISTAESRNEEKAFAINLRRKESDLTVIPTASLGQRLGLDTLYTSTDLTTLERLIQDHRVGHAYGEQLLWITFILVIIEFILANVLIRKRTDTTKHA
jgi:hypothetical protein